MLMAKVLVCEDLPDLSSGNPQCNQWAFYDVVVMGASDPAQVTVSDLTLAFSTGVVILLPLYALLWKIRAARAGINKS